MEDSLEEAMSKLDSKKGKELARLRKREKSLSRGKKHQRWARPGPSVREAVAGAKAGQVGGVRSGGPE